MLVKTLVVLAFAFLETSQVSSVSEDDSCGLRKSSSHNDLYRRIVGGLDAKPRSWPWQVEILRRDDKTNKYTHRCGAVLIGNQWVVTVAACTFQYPYPSFYKAVLGKIKQKEVIRAKENNHVYDVEELKSHEKYTVIPFGFDIALLKLARPVQLQPGKIWPVCLPSQGQRVSVGTECYMTGWGFTSTTSGYSDVLQEAKLVDHDFCAVQNLSKYSAVDEQTMLCAGYVGDKTVSGCRGDGGGPFVCEESGRWVLRGVVSWGDVQCKTLSVLTRISAFVDWIDETKKK